MFKDISFWKFITNKKNKYLPKINRCDLIKAKEYLWIYLGLFITDDMRNKHRKIMSKLNSSQQTFLTFYLFDSSMTIDYSNYSDPNEKINIKGGFLQAIYDGYAEYIFEKPFSEIIRTWGAEITSGIVEKAKSIYVKYKDKIKKVKTKKELFHLYSEITDFNILDEEYRMINSDEMEKIKEYIENNINEFAIIDEINSQTSNVDESIKESERLKKEMEYFEEWGMCSTESFEQKLKDWLKLDFDNLEDLEKTLYVLLENTPDKPYTVKLNIDDTVNFDALSGILMTTKKYVKLDLSGSVLTAIPEMAFKQNNFIVGIEIPKSVTSIGSSAFYGCASLTSVNFQCTVTGTNFDSNSFLGDLRDKYLAGGPGTYTTTAPVSDSSVWTITFTSITDMEAWLEAQPPNTSATAYTVKLNVNNLGGSSKTTGSVGNVLKLSERFNDIRFVNLDLSGSALTAIEEEAFYWCGCIVGVTLPGTVTSIGDKAFYGCPCLASVTIPSSVTSIGKLSFGFCSDLTAINADTANAAYSSQDGVLYNKNKTALVAYPGEKTGAFTIPDSVTSIGGGAFYDCVRLTSVTIPDSVTSIGEMAFKDCKSLTSVTIPDSVTSIGNYAFGHCTNLTNVNIPGSVTRIGGGAFYGCNSLTSITIPDNVTRIEDGAFDSCKSLTQIIIPHAVTEIGNNAFTHCTSLISVTIPDGVTTIGTYAFFGCTSLTSINIPNSVTSIGEGIFIDCHNLTAITVDSGNTNYSADSGVLYNKDKNFLHTYPAGKVLNTFTIPDSVTTIGQQAFEDCTNLTSVSIPNSVTSIGESAFSCCRFTSMTIPDSVISIGDGAFCYCFHLASVIIGNGVTSIGNYAFYGCTLLASITFQGTIPSSNFKAGYKRSPIFEGDLRNKFYETDATNGTPGTYTTTAPVSDSSVWTKQ